MIEVCMTQLEAQQPELAANLSVSSLESNILHLPLHVEKKEQPKKLADHEQDPLLLHPVLLNIPMQIRYGLAGFLANAIFIVAYNETIDKLGQRLAASTVYSIVYFFFIPFNHLILNLFVFGWPYGYYLTSLLQNYVVGFSAIMLGAAATFYLDKIGFEMQANEWVRHNLTYQQLRSEDESDDHNDGGEFYSSLLVLFISGIWSYVLLVMFNKPASKLEKKEQ